MVGPSSPTTSSPVSMSFPSPSGTGISPTVPSISHKDLAVLQRHQQQRGPFSWLFRKSKGKPRSNNRRGSTAEPGSAGGDAGGGGSPAGGLAAGASSTSGTYTDEDDDDYDPTSVVARNTLENAKSGTALLSSLRLYIAEGGLDSSDEDEDEKDEEQLEPVAEGLSDDEVVSGAEDDDPAGDADVDDDSDLDEGRIVSRVSTDELKKDRRALAIINEDSHTPPKVTPELTIITTSVSSPATGRPLVKRTSSDSSSRPLTKPSSSERRLADGSGEHGVRPVMKRTSSERRLDEGRPVMKRSASDRRLEDGVTAGNHFHGHGLQHYGSHPVLRRDVDVDRMDGIRRSPHLKPSQTLLVQPLIGELSDGRSSSNDTREDNGSTSSSSPKPAEDSQPLTMPEVSRPLAAATEEPLTPVSAISAQGLLRKVPSVVSRASIPSLISTTPTGVVNPLASVTSTGSASTNVTAAASPTISRIVSPPTSPDISTPSPTRPGAPRWLNIAPASTVGPMHPLTPTTPPASSLLLDPLQQYLSNHDDDSDDSDMDLGNTEEEDDSGETLVSTILAAPIAAKRILADAGDVKGLVHPRPLRAPAAAAAAAEPPVPTPSPRPLRRKKSLNPDTPPPTALTSDSADANPRFRRASHSDLSSRAATTSPRVNDLSLARPLPKPSSLSSAQRAHAKPTRPRQGSSPAMPEANKGCTSPPQAPKRLRSNSDVVRGSNSNANPATPAATAKTTSPTATPRRTASNSLPNTTAARRPGGLRRPDAPRGAKLVWADDAGSVLEVHHGFDDYLDRVLLLREERRRAEERRRKEEGGKDGRGFFEILSTGAAVPYSFG